MNRVLKADIAIIGAGSGGLSVAAGAVQMGASVILVEEDKMGGDCLNYGCIPSKALLAAAKTAQLIRNAADFGLVTHDPEIQLNDVMASVQKVIKKIAPHDSVERFEKLGVNVIQAQGIFQDPGTLKAGDYLIKARRFVIATGSSPTIPPIKGLSELPYYTNETIFNLTENPSHLVIIGGGPIGCELAQAFLLLGISVTVIEASTLLPRDEQDMVGLLRDILVKQGLVLHEATRVLACQQLQEKIEILVEKNGEQFSIVGSHLLIATGRTPNLKNLNLDIAKVKYGAKGINVDTRLRSSNPHIYAIGDVIGQYPFTHVASYQASIVLRNILFKIPAKINYRAVAWVTYTHPELAHIGPSSTEAFKHYPHTKLFYADFFDNDRAQTERDTAGKIKLITDKKGQVISVTILGANAGELILPWISIIQSKKTVRNFTDIIVPYPTLNEISKRVAGSYYTPLLFSKRTRWLVRLLTLFG